MVGRFHATSGQLVNALALYDRSSILLNHDVQISPWKKQDPKAGLLKIEMEPNEVASLREKVNDMVVQYRALVTLQESMDQKKTSTEFSGRSPLAERLNQYPVDDVDLSNLVDYPPQLRPVPVQPLFFDLAWNYIDYPGRQPSTSAAQPTERPAADAEKKDPPKRGWFGFGR